MSQSVHPLIEARRDQMFPVLEGATETRRGRRNRASSRADQRFFGDASYAIIGSYIAEVWPNRLRGSGMGGGAPHFAMGGPHGAGGVKNIASAGAGLRVARRSHS